MAEQRVHAEKSSNVSSLVEWMDMLTSETNSDETNIHTILQFQIVPLQTGYQAIVLCKHNEL